MENQALQCVLLFSMINCIIVSLAHLQVDPTLPWNGTVVNVDSLYEIIPSELERESFVNPEENLYAKLNSAFMHLNGTLGRMQISMELGESADIESDDARYERETGSDIARQGPNHANRPMNRSRVIAKKSGAPRRTLKTSRNPTKYLPYSPSHGKSDQASFAESGYSDGEELVLSRHPRQASGKNTAKRPVPVDDEENEEEEELPPAPKKSLVDVAYYSYDVDNAAEGGLKGYTKKNANTSSKSTEPDDPEADVLAFDIMLPAQPQSQATIDWDTHDPRQAKASAMRMARQDFRQKVAHQLPHCPAQGQPTGPQHEAPWVWAVGRPTNRTRFAYESEFAGKRLADRFGPGDPDHLFAGWNNEMPEDEEDCFALPEVECNRQNPYRTFDGTCNNLENPLKGTAGAPQRRLASASYADGLSKPRDLSVVSKVQGRPIPLPSSRRVSTALSRSINLPNNRVTSLFNQWSQLIAHEIVNTPVEKVPDPNNPRTLKIAARKRGDEKTGENGTGAENSVTPKCCDTSAACLHPACFPVTVPPDDPFYTQHGLHCLEFVRAQPAPRDGCKIGARRPINLNTAYIDGSNMYGSNKRDAKRLRAGRRGLLKINTSPIVREQGLVMVPGGRNALGCVAPNPAMTCPDSGDLRINQHTGLVAIHTLLLREHNRIATFISKRRPELSDETVFQVTRKIIGAIMQHITYQEMLPLIVGRNIYNNPANGLKLDKNGYCDCYDEETDAGILIEFQTAAFRFHTLLSDWLPARDPSGKFYPLYQHFGNAKMFYKPGIIDEILVNFPRDIPEKFDNEFGFIMQNQMFKPQDRPFGTDIVTLNIQRGKDCGTPTYMQMRSACKLPPIRSFQELERVMAPEIARKLSSVYKSVQDIDLFAGGVSENPVNGNGLIGPTFACVITEQFKRLRQGDRFWYENEGIFTPAQLREIRKTSMAALLCINSPTEDVQHRALLRDSPANPVVSCEEILSDQMRSNPLAPMQHESVLSTPGSRKHLSSEEKVR